MVGNYTLAGATRKRLALDAGGSRPLWQRRFAIEGRDRGLLGGKPRPRVCEGVWESWGVGMREPR